MARHMSMGAATSHTDDSPFIRGLKRTGASADTIRIAREVVRRQEEDAIREGETSAAT
jgi:hypothetical protein